MPPVPKILTLSLLFALNVVPVESSPTMVSLASPVVVESPDANNGIPPGVEPSEILNVLSPLGLAS